MKFSAANYFPRCLPEGLSKEEYFPIRGGQIKGNEFSFTVHFATPCRQYSMDVRGKVDNDQLTESASDTTGAYVMEGKRIAD